jgi:two-component system OmpR family sensor kinase/two-component system phosphate regulon sensor histidine kinase PhoR
MKKMSEGRKMWGSVMVIFAVYAVIFIAFEDYDRKFIMPFNEVSDWHLLVFSLVVMTGLGLLLLHYARRMDERISREQEMKESRMRRELTQNIAHELKTPVASILGYTETILDAPHMDETTRMQFVVRTHAQAQRLTALLQDISTQVREINAKIPIKKKGGKRSVLKKDTIRVDATIHLRERGDGI